MVDKIIDEKSCAIISTNALKFLRSGDSYFGKINYMFMWVYEAK